MKNLSLRQTLLILLLILTPLFLSMLPFFIQAYMSPADRVFMGLHRWSEDYYGYLHTINQGLMGHLQTVSKLTLQPHQPTFVHSEYVILGFLGRFLGLNSPLVYHLSRLFLGAVFVFVAFYFLYFLFCTFSPKPLKSYILRLTSLTFFLAFFVGGFPHITSWQPLHIEPYLSWWTELDVLTRSTILPHYLMGNIFFLLIIILFLKQINIVILSERSESKDLTQIKSVEKDSSTRPTGSVGMTRKKSFFFIGVFSFLLAFVHPIDFLILCCSLGLFVILRVFGNLNFKHLNLFRISDFGFRIFQSILSAKYQILLLLLVFVSGLLPALYYRFALSLPFWRFILAHGTTTAYNIPLLDLSLALGPVFFLGIGGIVITLTYCQTGGDQRGAPKLGSPCGKIFGAAGRQDPSALLLLFSWLFVQTLFFLKFYQVFNFDRLRTMEAPFYLPLAFFATIFILKLKGWPEKNFVRHSLIIVFVVLIFLITLPTTIIGLKNQIYQVSDFKTFSLFSYPTVKQYQAWQFLRDHTPDNSAITASYEATFLIPCVSGNKIAFAGNFDNDPNFNVNKNKITRFYQGLLNPEDALNFFHTNHISYIYWGYQEQSLGGDVTKYPFLQKIFSNGEVIIFKVK